MSILIYLSNSDNGEVRYQYQDRDSDVGNWLKLFFGLSYLEPAAVTECLKILKRIQFFFLRKHHMCGSINREIVCKRVAPI